MFNSDTTVAVRLGGGLGNMMFQSAFALAFSMKNNCNYCLVDFHKTSHENQLNNRFGDYSYNIFKYFCIDQPLNINLDKFILHKNCAFHFEMPKFILNSFNLYEGYFQSENYFFDWKDQIKSVFSPTNKEIDQIYNICDIKYKDYISIHVRRGDYIYQSSHHPILDPEYYLKAINFFGLKKNYIIFSDDINWCKNFFKFLNNTIFVESGRDYQHLYMMSKCAHNIIANSTFSWWGAWLNNENEVICPKKWFGPSLNHLCLSDIRPKKWLIFDV